MAPGSQEFVIAHYVGPQPFGQRLVSLCGMDYETTYIRAVRTPRLVTCEACLGSMPHTAHREASIRGR